MVEHPDIALMKKTLSLPPRKFTSFLLPVKDVLITARFLSIPCECDKVYIRQTGCSIETRIKELQWHGRLFHPNKTVMAKHSNDLAHSTQFQDTRILAM
jgi:hypothetical protein